MLLSGKIHDFFKSLLFWEKPDQKRNKGNNTAKRNIRRLAMATMDKEKENTAVTTRKG